MRYHGIHCSLLRGHWIHFRFLEFSCVYLQMFAWQGVLFLCLAFSHVPPLFSISVLLFEFLTWSWKSYHLFFEVTLKLYVYVLVCIHGFHWSESCHLSYEKSIPKKRGGKTLTFFSLQRERKYGNYISVYSSGILDPCFVFSTVIWVVRIHWFSYVGPH